jgi:RNA polymerase sigma-70 factor (ECF subfamily)
MERLAAGEHEALAPLFDAHAPIVLGVLMRMLRRRSEAEEVLQEAFLQAWQQADRYQPALASPRSWLLMLARSRALDRIRSEQARSRREDDVAAAPLTTDPFQPAGTAQIEADERRQLLVAALSALPAEQRRCIELAFFEGLSHSQIAQRLDEPLGTVKSRILLGMRKMRVLLERYR